MTRWLMLALLSTGIALPEQQPETMSVLEKPLYAPPLAREERTARQAVRTAAHAAHQRDPANVDAVLALARADVALGHIGNALETLTRALEVKPDEPRLTLERGRNLIVIRKFELAARELRRSAETLPDAWCALGVAHYLAADYPQAREALGKCTGQGTSPVFAYLADWRTGPSAMPRPMISREPSPDPSAPIRLPGAATKPGPTMRIPLAAMYLDAAERLMQGDSPGAKALLKQIVEKDRHHWMDPVYIAAEVDYARLLKAEPKRKQK